MTANIDIYDTFTMLETLQIMHPPKSFFLDTFFTEFNYSQNRHVVLDIEEDDRTLAPFVSPKREGKAIEKDGYSTKIYEPPYIKPLFQIDDSDVLRRQAGQTIYLSVSPAEKAEMALARTMRKAENMLTRREETMAIEMMTTGKITVSGDGVDYEIDFSFPSTHTKAFADFDADELWTHADALPLDQLDEWGELIEKDSGKAARILILGLKAWQGFRNNTQVKSAYDNRRIEVGLLKETNDKLPSGARYKGTYGDVEIYTYTDFYTDSNGTLQRNFPTNKAVLASKDARCIRHYGAIRDVQYPGLQSVRMWPKSWIQENPSARMWLGQSAPLPVNHELKSLFVAEPVAAS